MISVVYRSDRPKEPQQLKELIALARAMGMPINVLIGGMISLTIDPAQNDKTIEEKYNGESIAHIERIKQWFGARYEITPKTHRCKR